MKIPTDYEEGLHHTTDCHKIISPHKDLPSKVTKATDKQLLANLLTEDSKMVVVDFEKETIVVDGKREASFKIDHSLIEKSAVISYYGAKIMKIDGVLKKNVTDLIRDASLGHFSLGDFQHSIYNVSNEQVYSTKSYSSYWNIEKKDKIVGKIRQIKSNLIEVELPSTPYYQSKALILAISLFCFKHPGNQII